MAKFVIHKSGFFYTDEAYELVEGANGSIVEAFENLEDAKKEKYAQDIISMQKMHGMNAVDFFFYSTNYDEVYGQFEDYYKSEFGLAIPDKHRFDFPEEISPAQAQKFLEILKLSFHNIIEYADDIELNPDDFNLIEEDLGEF